MSSFPKLKIPTFEIELPSTQEKITIRPFLVKEEKILLMALQGNDPREIVNAVKQIINNCIVHPQKFDLDKLTNFQIEYIFLQLRMKSVGDKLKLRFLPRENTDCQVCKKERTVQADLNEAKIVYNEEHTNNIKLDEHLGIIMRYPGFNAIVDLDRSKNSQKLDDFFKLIWECIQTIYDEEKQYNTRDISLKDGIAFLEELSHDQFSKIEDFFKTMPKLRLDVSIDCLECGFHEVYPIIGLENFFV